VSHCPFDVIARHQLGDIMFISIKRASALSAALLTCLPVTAQPITRPDPLNASTPVPALTYQSSFAKHQRFSDDAKPLSWREANETAARIGGWRVYAREAQSTSSPAAAPASSPSAHQHHKP
jgi:hypothetical protein